MLEGVGRVAAGIAPQKGVGLLQVEHPEPGVERQVVGPGEHVHGVELEYALGAQIRRKVAFARRPRRSLAREPLGIQKDASGLGGAHVTGHERHCNHQV